MRKLFLLVLACSLFLCSCGKQLYLPEAQNDYTFGVIGGADGPTSIIVGEPSDVLENLKTKIHVGEGYTIEIPEKGWEYEKEYDDGVLEEAWEYAKNDHAEFKVWTYKNSTEPKARSAFLRENEDFVYEDLMGYPLCGFEKDGLDVLWFHLYEQDGDVYIVSWEYSAAASDDSSILLSAIANSFTLK